MDQKKTSASPIAWVLGQTGPHKGQYVLSVILAVIGVAFSAAPYFVVARIAAALLDGNRDFGFYLARCGILALLWLGRVLFHAFSTATSHKATFAVLGEIRNADGLIIGSPNYLGEMTASFRALYERLIFQYLTYNLEKPCCNERPIPVLLMMTSNAPDTYFQGLMWNYQQTFSRFVGPTEIFVSGDTLQLKDYGATDWPWTLFDAEKKKERRETVFPAELQKARELGAALVRGH